MGAERAYPDRPVLAVGAVVARDGKVLYHMTHGAADVIRRLLARRSSEVQDLGG